MRHHNAPSSVFPHMTRPGETRPAFIYTNLQALGMRASGLLRVLGEGGIDFALLDACGGISGLAEILLLGTVAHHTRVWFGGVLLAVLGIGLVGHFEISRGG